MIDNPMLNWSNPPEWEMIEEDFCNKCSHFAEMCDCEQPEFVKADAVICPDCRQTVLDNDADIAIHARSCDGPDTDYEEFYAPL